MIERKELLEKLLRLRCRIEDWAQVHGWENIKNAKETWGKGNNKGLLVWKQTDWECVDSMYNTVMNHDEITWGKEAYKVLNLMWKRYKLETRLVYNPYPLYR